MKETIVDAIIASNVRSGVLSKPAQSKQFLQQYFENVPVEDLLGRPEDIMARAALDHLEFGTRRRRGQALVRIFNPTPEEHGYSSNFTIVEMINDDMPFLVDSVSAAVDRHNLAVHITVHPIIFVTRDNKGLLTSITGPQAADSRSESFVRFAIDRETDASALKTLHREIKRVLSDVRIAVRDWGKMKERMLETRQLLANGPKHADKLLRSESQELLEWLADDHFTFLGYREYRLKKVGKRSFLESVDGSGLGLLYRDDRGSKSVELTAEMRRLTRSRDWLILTKANSRSTVHRSAFLDYVGVKMYDAKGNAVGERRFIGLLTSVAYNESPRNIPLLRHKIRRVFERARVDASGHRGKALSHIIESYPREELFQSTVQDLARTTIGILNLQDRKRVKFFLRRDAFRRFFSCLVFIPREKYTTAIRKKVEAFLKAAFEGIAVDSAVQISESALARVHIIVRTEEGERPPISIQKIETQIAEMVVTWTDKLRQQLFQTFDQDQDEARRLNTTYGNIFPAGYQEDTLPSEGCSDVRRIDDMLRDGVDRTVHLYEPPGSEPGHMHFMVYGTDHPIALSDALPIIENMGVDVYAERPYEALLKSQRSFWIQDFHLRHESGEAVDIDSVDSRFEECFMAVLGGVAENDGLNRLVISAGLNWRETALLRCYAKHAQQLGLPFSQAYMEDVLVAHARFVRLLVQQFDLQFNPGIAKSRRAPELEKTRAAVERNVAKAKNVDEDRILTAFAGSVNATLRSNYYLNDSGHSKSYISIKLDPSRLPEVPLPRPKFEIFVYSPEVEGVHLRGGDIARGGLRWSDRREDFRTEVLGLMKAQVVKNTVIVPTGAKGGFFPKRAPTGDRDAIMRNGIDCYKTFISGLLDVTDNVIDGKVVTPEGIVRRDGDDPYLVVAADKGTATFSDIANGISADYDFWLDDAFASGGSAGYDHKKMGITARGAWEAVKRHFRELGLNTQKEPFTVAGIGDMAGDVFGNGMLLSRKIQLVAAFNHRHIFLDPTPEIAASYRERQRLFKTPRTGWDDYDETLISKGGGVFSRDAKTIRLSREVRKLLDVTAISLKPNELINAILKMPVDLLWNGGIGTYVKASHEGHGDAGDRGNDAVRVDAGELRCKVIGEGGNLGLTQLARVEYSLAGGRINTDFIDNSAGVDSSDREVNIKILLGDVTKHKGMTRAKRNTLLESMTDDVAELVLRNNYLQTQSISMSETLSADRIDETAGLIKHLEQSGLLNREIEFLPDEVEIDERRSRKIGFTRPELAVVLSYAKIDLYNGLIMSEETLEEFLTIDPPRYFPTVLRRRYSDLLPGHRLSRQILATLIANDLVNRMGQSFVKRVQADTGAHIVTVARAYKIARVICRAGPLLRTIESLDYKIPASAQVSMMFEVSRTLRHACYWLIEHFGDDLNIEKSVDRLKDNMAQVYSRSSAYLSRASRARHEKAEQHYLGLGVPQKLANRMSVLLLTRPALDMSDLAATRKRDVLDVARLYSTFNDALGLHWLHNQAEDLKVSGRWQAKARSNLRDEFFRIRRELAFQLLKPRSKTDAIAVSNQWLSQHENEIEQYKNMIEEMKLRDEVDFATLTVAAQEFRHLISN